MICFDLGNVLVEVYKYGFLAELAQFAPNPRNDHSYNQLWTERASFDWAEAYFKSSQGEMDLGMTNIEIISRVLTSNDSSKLKDAWQNMVRLNPVMLEFVEKLLETNHVAILSNIGSDHAKLLRSAAPKLFNHKNLIQHLSFEVGARKPTKLYFQSFMLDHPSFDGSLYLDDREENLSMGDSYGLHPFHFELDKFIILSKDKQQEMLDSIIIKMHELL